MGTWLNGTYVRVYQQAVRIEETHWRCLNVAADASRRRAAPPQHERIRGFAERHSLRKRHSGQHLKLRY